MHHGTLAGQQTQLTEEPSRALRHDYRLSTAGVLDVDDLDRTFEDNDQAVEALALTEEGFAGLDVVHVAEVRQPCQLGRGQSGIGNRIRGGADSHGAWVGLIVHGPDGTAAYPRVLHPDCVRRLHSRQLAEHLGQVGVFAD